MTVEKLKAGKSLLFLDIRIEILSHYILKWLDRK